MDPNLNKDEPSFDERPPRRGKLRNAGQDIRSPKQDYLRGASSRLQSTDPVAHPVYKVEGVVFAVDRHYFEESEVFRDMFTLPTNEEEGKCLVKPVHLWGIAAGDFTAFLDALHFPYVNFLRGQMKLIYLEFLLFNRDNEEGIPLSVEEWKGVLRLAHMWCFESTMALAIQFLDELLDDVSKIRLSLIYDYKPWYYPALRRLAERREDLTAQEVEQVGWDIAQGIQALREIFSIRSLQDLERSGMEETLGLSLPMNAVRSTV